MRISLVFNPRAGDGLDVDALVALLVDAGHDVHAHKSGGPWRDLLQDPGDLLVGAGGDGTVRDVAMAAARADVPFAALPFGTANNVAKSLGVVGRAEQVVRAWDLAAARPFDLGQVSGPTNGRFVEAFGGGLFADLIAAGNEVEDSVAQVGRETDRALGLLGERLESANPAPWEVSVDGEDHSGDYLAVEVLNIRFSGPNVPLAPMADSGDGVLDVVLIPESSRPSLAEYVRDRLHVASGTLEPLPVVRGARIRLVAPPGSRLRLDDDLWPDDGPIEERLAVEIECLPGAATVIAPPLVPG